MMKKLYAVSLVLLGVFALAGGEAWAAGSGDTTIIEISPGTSIEQTYNFAMHRARSHCESTKRPKQVVVLLRGDGFEMPVTFACKGIKNKQDAAVPSASTTTTTIPATTTTVSAKDRISRDGVYGVGTNINPGRWTTDGAPTSCYYAVLNSPNTSDIADNNNTAGPATVDLAAGQFFEVSGCGAWYRIG